MKNFIPNMRLVIILFIVFVVTLLMTSCGPSSFKDVPVLVKTVGISTKYIQYFSEQQLRVISVGDTVYCSDDTVVVIKIAAE